MALALRRPSQRSATRATAGDGTAATRPGSTHVAAARSAWAVGSVMTLVARLVRLAAIIVFAIIVAGIILAVVGANMSNTIVHDVHSVASALVGPFKNVFTVKNPKASVALNWGLAAVVYLLIGTLIASLIVRLAPSGVHPREPVV